MPHIVNAPTVYELCQVLTDPRNGEKAVSSFSEYATLAQAIKEGEKYLSDVEYVVLEKRVVFANGKVRHETR